MPALRFHPGGFQEGRPAGLSGVLQDLCRRLGRLAQDPCTKARGTWAKFPKRLRQTRDLSDRLKLLQKKLSKAIEDENFEQAAQLRDEIKQMNARLGNIASA